MNKREFLAVGGAVPLMLAGCGGSGNGSAPVRLVNASVDYPSLGFMDESTQAATGIAYGAASTYYNVEAGSVDITLTTGTTSSSAAAAQTRSINKDTRYTLVAYGFTNELRSALLTESTTTPDSGKANINVYNTSTDIGAVDVYLSTDPTNPYVNQIASNVGGGSQSAFSAMAVSTSTGGTSYYITVVGAYSVSKGLSDVRFQSSTAQELDNQKVYTIILTPGESGVLANAIVMLQGSDVSTAVKSYSNSTARVRAVTSVGSLLTSVVGTNSSSTSGSTTVTILTESDISRYSDYFVVNVGTAPVVTVAGNAIKVTMDGASDPTAAAVLAAGGDYTLMVYLDSNNNPVAKAVLDKNTAPVSSAGGKFRLINLASDNKTLELSMQVNAQAVATNIPYASASAFTEIASLPQSANTLVLVKQGSKTVISNSTVLALGNIYTEIVTSIPPGSTSPEQNSDFFLAASLSA